MSEPAIQVVDEHIAEGQAIVIKDEPIDVEQSNPYRIETGEQGQEPVVVSFVEDTYIATKEQELKFDEQKPLSTPSKTADSDEQYSKSARSNAIDFEDNPYLKISAPKDTSEQIGEIVVIDKDRQVGAMLAAADGAYSSESDDEVGDSKGKMNK